MNAGACVGSVIVILVRSTYSRIVFKMFFVSIDDSDHFTVITLAVLITLRFYYVARAQLSIRRFRFLLLFIL